jgi:putative membrane protein
MMGGAMIVWALLWTLIGIAVLVLAVVAIVYLVHRMNRSSSDGGGRGPSAEEVLRRRYAAGEIDEDEFHRRRAAMS